jgi:hypothetical protein
MRGWALAGLVLSTACDTTVEPPGDPNAGVTPTIAIALDRGTITLTAGEAAQPVRVTLARTGAATAPVDLQVTGLPAGVRASFTPTTLSGAATSATIDFTVTTAAPAGAVNATVTATSGTLTAQAPLGITVRRQ